MHKITTPSAYDHYKSLYKLKYLDTIRERLRCRKIGGGERVKNSENGWVTNNGGFVNK